jgi:hypothetical protein
MCAMAGYQSRHLGQDNVAMHIWARIVSNLFTMSFYQYLRGQAAIAADR